MTARRWEDVPPLVGDGKGWVEVTNNGWGALVVWAAGLEHTRRKPGNPYQGSVAETRTTAGLTTMRYSPVTQEDIRAADDDIDAYLADAGIPPRPRGQVWFLRLPSELHSEKELWVELNRSVSGLPAGANRPAQFFPTLSQALARLFERSP